MDRKQMNSNTNNKNGYQPKNNSTAKSRNRLPQKKNYRPRTNRRYVPNRRNRLQRVQNALNYNNRNKTFQQPRQRKIFNKFSMRPIQYAKRELFIKGLPRFIDNKGLFNLFKKEGRIINCNVLYDNVGFSRGIGKIEFLNYRDAWKVINKWNNATYKGFTLKVEYRKVKNQTRFVNNRGYGQFFNYQKNNNYSRKYNGNNYNYYYFKNNY